MVEKTGIDCDACGQAELIVPTLGAQYECPECGAIVAPEVAKRNQW